MMRNIVKWWISNAIDQSRDLSPWLKRVIARDEELSRFEREARWLAGELRNHAAAWVDESLHTQKHCRPTKVQHHLVGRDRDARRPAWVMAAWAACLLLAATVGAWLLMPPRDHRTGLAQTEPHPAMSADPQALARFLRAGQSVLQPLSRLPERVSMRPLPRPHQWDDQARSLVNRGFHQVYGDLHASLQRERRQVTNDLRSAVVFFSQIVPTETVRLLGLSRG